MLRKLKHEWKTFAWGVISLSVELWDVILSAQLSYVEPLVPSDYQWIVHIAVPAGFFILRRWKDAHDAVAD